MNSRCHVVALMLLGLLTACASQPIHPEPRSSSNEPRIQPNSVLVLKFLSGDRLEESWQPASLWRSELSCIKPTTSVEMGQIVFVSSRPRDCDQEQIDCHRECMRRKPPNDYGPKMGFRHVNYCNNKCLDLYMDCLKAQGLFPARFQGVDEVADWMRQHPEAMVAGGIVVIAGASFVVLSGGAGLLVLAPLALLP